jgi:hypothetical protein
MTSNKPLQQRRCCVFSLLNIFLILMCGRKKRYAIVGIHIFAMDDMTTTKAPIGNEAAKLTGCRLSYPRKHLHYWRVLVQFSSVQPARRPERQEQAANDYASKQTTNRLQYFRSLETAPSCTCHLPTGNSPCSDVCTPGGVYYSLQSRHTTFTHTFGVLVL